MKGLLARIAVTVTLFGFAAGSASWSMEGASAQGRVAATPTPVAGSPNVVIQIEDDNIVVGDPARITLIAFDDRAVDWIRWDARLSSDLDNDNSDAADNAEADNGEADNAPGTPVAASGNDNALDDDEDNDEADNENDNRDDRVSAGTDPALAARHDFECDDQTACASVWTVMTSKPGRYTIRAEVRDTTGLRGAARAEIQVRATR